MGSDEDYIGTYIEYVDDRLDLILEILDSFKTLPTDVTEVKRRLSGIENQMSLIVPLVKEQNSRLAKLETT